jgi:hypothetical protein
MNVHLIVDGQSEFASLPALFDELHTLTGDRYRVVAFDIQPMAHSGTILRQCTAAVKQSLARGADRVVILIDREDRPDCPGLLATEVGAKLAALSDNIEIVIKNRAYENWVIADIDALRKLPRMFSVSKATARAVQPNKADSVAAGRLLERARDGRHYDKVQDSRKVLAKARVENIAEHSRSFRRFLRCIGCPIYLDQSIAPVNHKPTTTRRSGARSDTTT